ncbi:MAG: transcriptional regulator [Balneolaceae bacterium]|nr:MAG: transcriptional regulator [Balneolaceae bacterium]
MSKSIEQFMKTHSGYATMSEFKEAGIHTRNVREAVDKEVIIKIKPGLYKLRDFQRDGYEGFVDVHTANNSAIICLVSALAYHEFTTFNPSRIDVAVPNNTGKFELNYPPINVYFFRENMYKAGVDLVDRGYGSFKVYNKPKTVCDMFRYRNKLGEDLALEGLQNYLNRSDSNLNELSKYMKLCRVKTVMEPYVKAMAAVL